MTFLTSLIVICERLLRICELQLAFHTTARESIFADQRLWFPSFLLPLTGLPTRAEMHPIPGLSQDYTYYT